MKRAGAVGEEGTKWIIVHGLDQGGGRRGEAV